MTANDARSLRSHAAIPMGQTMECLSAIVGLVALLISAGCGGTSSSNTSGTGGGPVPATVSGTIKVGTAPSAVTVDSTNDKIYVADFGTIPPLGGRGYCSPSGSDIRVIDGATQSTTTMDFTFFVTYATWTPYAVAVNPANHTLYVVAALFGPGLTDVCGLEDDGIELFDTTTGTQDSNIGTLLSVGGVDVNLTTGNIYATDYAFRFVAVLDGSPIAKATIPVGTGPAGVALSATTNKIYVANSGSNNISVIDGTSNSVITTIADPKAIAPFAVAVNPTTNTIYVANSQSNNLTVIDGATDSVTATIPVGTSPSGVAVDSQANFIYVANAGNSQTGNPGNITVINGTTNATQTVADPNAKNPVAVAVNSITNKIYVANSGSNNVTVIDGAHN